jgi:small multidrug resistance pump
MLWHALSIADAARSLPHMLRPRDVLARAGQHQVIRGDDVWLLLACAIVSEVTATISLRFAQGFSRVGPSVIVAAGYGLSFWLFGKVLQRGLPVGVAYGIWCAAGMSLVAIIAAIFLDEPLSWLQVGGLALIIAGITTLQYGAK